MRESFGEMGFSPDAVTDELFSKLNFQLAELIALRLYTGPMFVYYNGTLRAMGGNQGIVARGPDKGRSVQGKFVSSIHAINSGLIKLSRLQPCCYIYRGVNGMKLPEQFLEPDVHNMRGGVESGLSWDSDVTSKTTSGAATAITSAASVATAAVLAML